MSWIMSCDHDDHDYDVIISVPMLDKSESGNLIKSKKCLHWGKDSDSASEVGKVLDVGWKWKWQSGEKWNRNLWIWNHFRCIIINQIPPRYQTFSDAMDICEELGERGSFLTNFGSYNEYINSAIHPNPSQSIISHCNSCCSSIKINSFRTMEICFSPYLKRFHVMIHCNSCWFKN